MLPERKKVTRQMAITAIQQANGDEKLAAQLLGCTLDNLRKRIEEIKKNDDRKVQ